MGGPSRAIRMMERALASAGVAVTTLTTDDDGPGRRLAAAGCPAEANGARRAYVRKRGEFYKVAPGAIPWLWRRAGSFDVIHVHALFSFVSVAACMIAHLKGVPYIVRPLGVLSVYGVKERRPWLKRLSLRLVEGPLLRRAAAVHFTSPSEYTEAKELGFEMRGEVIPLGVEMPASGERRPSLGLDDIPGRPVVLFLSRLDPKKNVEGLLRAFSALTGDGHPPALLIAGGGTPRYMADLKDLAASLGIEKDVFWLGHLEGERKAAALAAADVFVLPSFSENFGIAAAEALFSGLPCVLGKGVAIAQDAEDAGAAIVVAPEPEAIAAAITALLGDASLRQAMGTRGKAFAEREYAPGAMAERLATLYKKVARASC
jgi:glycosyltransferase involved in cell wall biosynthesis